MEQLLKKLENLFADLEEVKMQLADIKKQLGDSENARYFEKWIPRKALMRFLDYGDTKIAALFKKEDLDITEIGNRKFIKKESVIKMLEKYIKKTS